MYSFLLIVLLLILVMYVAGLIFTFIISYEYKLDIKTFFHMWIVLTPLFVVEITKDFFKKRIK